MSKKLRELVERLALAPSPANRDAFLRGLIISMVWTPLRPSGPKERAEGPTPPGGQSELIMVGPDGESMLLVYADGEAALREPGVKSAGGDSGRKFLERALSSGAGLAVTTGHETIAPRAVVTLSEIPAVLELERTEDPVLGVITWHPSSDDSKDAAARDRIVREAARTPTPDADGTATWSLALLRRALRTAPDGGPHVSTFTIRQVLHGAGYTCQRTRAWCPTGSARRTRTTGVATVTDPDAGAPKS